MTSKQKIWEFMKIIIGMIFSVIGTLLVLGITGWTERIRLTNESLEKKADKVEVYELFKESQDYIDKRDSEIMDAHNKYEATHQIQHNAEYNALDKKIDSEFNGLDKKMDVVIKLIESK